MGQSETKHFPEKIQRGVIAKITRRQLDPQAFRGYQNCCWFDNDGRGEESRATGLERISVGDMSAVEALGCSWLPRNMVRFHITAASRRCVAR